MLMAITISCVYLTLCETFVCPGNVIPPCWEIIIALQVSHLLAVQFHEKFDRFREATAKDGRASDQYSKRAVEMILHAIRKSSGYQIVMIKTMLQKR